MYEFTSLDSFTIKERGTVFIVDNVHQLTISELLDLKVKIDNTEYTIKGIETMGPADPPYTIGLFIGLIKLEENEK